MASFPNYLKRSQKTGSYSYRRRVPDDCRETLGKREHKVSLKTKVHSVALGRAAQVNADFEKAITQIRAKASEPAPQETSPIDRQLAIEAAHKILMDDGIHPKQKPDYKATFEEIERYELLRGAFDSNYLAYKHTDTDPKTWNPIYGPSSASDPYDQADRILGGNEPIEYGVTLKDSVEFYLSANQEKKQRTPYNQKKFEQAIWRATDRLASFLGTTKANGYKTPLKGFSRALMRSFRDDLKRKNPTWAIATINKDVQRLQAVFIAGNKHFELGLANPFDDLKLEASKRTTINRRRSFTPAEYADYVAALSTKKNEQMALIGLLMLATGCRTGEAAGLTIGEVKLDANIPFIEIRHNYIREVKNDASERDVPVVGSALERLRAYLSKHTKADGPKAPLFPQYGRDGGTDAVSAVLNKVIRKDLGISDPTLVSYSARHTMKDKLRAVATLPHLQEDIMGHSAGNIIAEGYGSSGIPLDQKLAEMNKADGCLSW